MNPQSVKAASILSHEGRPPQNVRGAAQVDNPYARQDRQNSNIVAQNSSRPENGANRQPDNLYRENYVQPNIVPPNNPYIRKDGYSSASKLIQPKSSVSNSFDRNDAYPSNQGVQKNASSKTSPSSNQAYGRYRSPNHQSGFQAEHVNGAANRVRSCPG